jgi:hypothetical protein
MRDRLRGIPPIAGGNPLVQPTCVDPLIGRRCGSEAGDSGPALTCSSPSSSSWSPRCGDSGIAEVISARPPVMVNRTVALPSDSTSSVTVAVIRQRARLDGGRIGASQAYEDRRCRRYAKRNEEGRRHKEWWKHSLSRDPTWSLRPGRTCAACRGAWRGSCRVSWRRVCGCRRIRRARGAGGLSRDIRPPDQRSSALP